VEITKQSPPLVLNVPLTPNLSKYEKQTLRYEKALQNFTEFSKSQNDYSATFYASEWIRFPSKARMLCSREIHKNKLREEEAKQLEKLKQSNETLSLAKYVLRKSNSKKNYSTSEQRQKQNARYYLKKKGILK
jgi:hypothetical protein